MVNKNSITINNRSGAHQHYAIFNKPPTVTGSVSGQVWSNVFATASTPQGQRANVSVYKKYYAIVGYSQDSPRVGVQVDVSGSKDVTLGSTESDGSTVPGTTLQLLVQDGAPQFGDDSLSDEAPTDAFEIQTGSDFTISEAKNGHYLIGLGGTRNGNSIDGPAAIFVPEPNETYQIEPVNTYYVTVGDYTKGSLIDANEIGGTVVTIDFDEYSSGQVTVVHNDWGQLVIQEQD
ncbi:hypothetical protein KAF25_001359 [Fusarium avenaceum]|uniref:Uncharacterized protein n=1 Tax=Fusarium avenaceum TaxID=40199 RepID=A0A9P7HBL7_9HYPO|nr:hypothetical protein KAF25_001359 [Fusarium avenaceum]